MKKRSINAHLKPYSIVQKRTTTINHAFASAIAPAEDYQEEKVNAAIHSLGQHPDRDLHCVYCGELAETWDHLVGLVEKAQLRGFGHQLGNLVPCCRSCNSAKGAKDWVEFLRWKTPPSEFEAKRGLIRSYLDRYAVPVDSGRMEESRPEDWRRYGEIKRQILSLMKEADEVAHRLRQLCHRDS